MLTVRVRLLLGALLIVSSALTVMGAPQGPTPRSRPKGQGLGVVTDGSKNPERIPGHVAIEMFLSSIAIPTDADRKAIALMQVKIAPMRLSRRDAAILRGEMAGLHGRLAAQREAIVASRANPESPTARETAAGAAAFASIRKTLSQDSYTRLIETLSPDGRQKLAGHIARVKTQMKSLGRRR